MKAAQVRLREQSVYAYSTSTHRILKQIARVNINRSTMVIKMSGRKDGRSFAIAASYFLGRALRALLRLMWLSISHHSHPFPA